MCVCHHCLGEEQDKLESPQFLPEISGLLLEVGMKTFLPNLGVGVAPHHCPAPLTAPLYSGWGY